MFKIAFKSLLGHKLRMVLTSIAIVLGVGFVSGSYVLTDSMRSTFDNLFSDVYSGIDVTVRPLGEGESLGYKSATLPEELVDEVRSIEGVSVAAVGVSGYAQLVDDQGQPIGGQGPPTLGFSWIDNEGLNPLKIDKNDGRPPTGPGEVAIDKFTAETYGLEVGDTVSIQTDLPVEEFTIVGIAKFGTADSLAGATISVFELSVAQRLFGYNQGYNAIDIKATTGVEAEELKQIVQDQVGPEYEVVTGAEQANEQLESFTEALGFFSTMMLTLAGIAVFVGSYIIANTFRIVVSQRSKELAVFRAIGSTRTQVVIMVMYEALIVALVASLLGVVLGIGMAAGIKGMLSAIGLPLPDGPLQILPRTALVGVGVGVAVTSASALLPAIKASRISPVEAMRENMAATSNRHQIIRRALIGLVLVIGGGASLIYGLNDSGDQIIQFVGFGSVMMFVGVTIMAPALVGAITGLIGALTSRIFGVAGQLATGNSRREPRRTASSASALMIGVSLVVFVSVLTSSFKATISDIFAETFPADLTFISLGIGDAGPGTAGYSSQAVDNLRQLPELKDVTAFRYLIDGFKLNDEPIFIAGVDIETFDEVVKLNPSEGAYQRVASGQIIVREGVAEAKGWQTGQELSLQFGQKPAQSIALAGTFSEAYDADYIISSQVYLQNVSSDTVTFAAANVNDGVDLSTAKQAAETALSGFPTIEVQDQADLIKTAEDQINQILALLWALLGMALLIAVLGIANTLLLSISERTKEIGMLRSIGMTRRQVKRMIRLESIIVTLFGAILGLAMGIFFAWAVVKALEDQGVTSFVVPPNQVVGYLIFAVIAGVVAAAWPARKAAKLDPIKAIKYE